MNAHGMTIMSEEIRPLNIHEISDMYDSVAGYANVTLLI